MYFCIILGYDSCCLLPELSCRRILHCTFYRYSSWICHHCPTAIKCISLRMRSKKGNKRPDHCQKYSSVFCSFFLSEKAIPYKLLQVYKCSQLVSIQILAEISHIHNMSKSVYCQNVFRLKLVFYAGLHKNKSTNSCLAEWNPLLCYSKTTILLMGREALLILARTNVQSINRNLFQIRPH